MAVYEELNEFIRQWAFSSHPVLPALRPRRQALAKLILKWDAKRADYVSRAAILREVGIYSYFERSPCLAWHKGFISESHAIWPGQLRW